MVNISVIASSSKGNCYTVSDGKTTLMLECGVSISRIREGLGFRLSRVAACLVSHEHRDHSAAAQVLIRHGVPVYMSAGTAQALECQRARILEPKKQVQIGEWTVLPFPILHDAAEPFGFLLASGDNKILFATDTAGIPYRFQGVTHLMIEANYCPEIVRGKLACGDLSKRLADRLRFSHFSINDVRRFLAAGEWPELREIYLLHLSDEHSDAARFQREVASIAGVPVYVAARSARAA